MSFLPNEEEEAASSQVACAGCRRVIGVTTSVSPIPRIYCSEDCLDDFPVSDNESRDDLIFYLLHKQVPKGQIGDAFGLSRQRIIQMSHARKSEGVLGD
jgi:hypothetical protein